MYIYKNCILKIKKGDELSDLQDFLREHEFDLAGYKFVDDIDLFVSTVTKEELDKLDDGDL